MKILHLCLGCFYIDNYSYQENMLPKFHKQMGYDVEIIASTVSFNSSGKGCHVEAGSYENEYGIHVTRLPYFKFLGNKIGKFLRIYNGTYEAIKGANPDIIFVHGCQFLDMKYVVKYAKKHKVTIYVDNHADFSNSATNWLSKNILHGLVWRHCAQIIEPYTDKFYGVLPVRVDFLKNVYHIPEQKCELLVMGADDDLVEKANADSVKSTIRNQLGIKDNDFLIITGGKIDQWKTQTFLLMEAVKRIQMQNVKLVVFGSVVDELKEKMNNLVDGEKIQYIGWITSTDSYKYFAASDLVVFPGRHSVMWEQVAAQGIPMIVKQWEGTTHIDLKGNVLFLKEDSVDEIEKTLIKVLTDDNQYLSMRKCAREKGMEFFSYKNIAARSIKE